MSLAHRLNLNRARLMACNLSFAKCNGDLELTFLNVLFSFVACKIMKPSYSLFLHVAFVFFVGASFQLAKGKQRKFTNSLQTD